MKAILMLIVSNVFVNYSYCTQVSDSIPPVIDTVIITGANQIDVLFSEATHTLSTETATHYTLSENQAHPTYVIQDIRNSRLAHLVFSFDFTIRKNYDLLISGITDLNSLLIHDTTVRFVNYVPMPYDIIIDEIMADPSPSNGLPEAEWIEIRNASPFDINLVGWRLAKPTSRSGPMGAIVLKPDSMIVICSSGSINGLSVFCSPIAVTYFPSISNTEDKIILIEPGGRTIHAIHFTDDWYQNQLKKLGGWSLEMIDINNPCTGTGNWSASVNIIGATPGRINSIDALNLDITSPVLYRAYASDSTHLVLVFNEPMDSIEAMNRFHYQIDNGIGVPDAVSPMANFFDKIQLHLSQKMVPGIIYNVTVSGLKDCISNMIGIRNHARVGLASLPDSLDVIVNEILYNPREGVSDFVELYNRSKKIINIKHLHICHLNSSGVIDNISDFPDDGFLLFPEEFMAFTTDSYSVKRAYVSENPDAIIQITNMPSFNDDEGDVIILNQDGNILDKLHYDDRWQFPLLDETEGVSLERINHKGITQDQLNWHSASASSGFATPGYRNSQTMNTDTIAGEIQIYPPVISPDNDGRDDVGMIQYSFPDPGNTLFIIIFDVTGRPVRHLVTNILCGTKGLFTWDGLDDLGKKILSGNYIIVTDLFNIKGKTKRIRKLMAVRN